MIDCKARILAALAPRGNSPQSAFQPAIADRLRQVRAGDGLAPAEVGDGARQAQDPVVGARRQVELVDGTLQQALVGRYERAVARQLAGAEQRIGFAGARELALARGDHALAHGGAGLARRRVVGQRGGRLARHLDLDVDAVQQRAGDPAAIARHQVRRAAAAAGGIAGVAAGTWSRCSFAGDRRHLQGIEKPSIQQSAEDSWRASGGKETLARSLPA